MNRAILTLTLLPLLGLAAGCDSIVGGRCAEGMVMVAGECRLDGPDAGGDDQADADPTDAEMTADADTTGHPDGAPGPDAASPPDAGVCTADTENDPFNCGACGIVCPTGLCVDSECVGDFNGHTVVIGHDYVAHNAAMARLLGNAAALSTRSPLRIAQWRGTASAAAASGTNAALTQGLALIGQPWSEVAVEDVPTAFDAVDVIVIDAQRGPAADMVALGTAIAGPAAAFVANGGVIVVLEGHAGTSHDLVTAAGLATITDISDEDTLAISLAIPTDGVATGVPQPYAGAASTVWFTTTSPGVFIDEAGRPVVVHTSPAP